MIRCPRSPGCSRWSTACSSCSCTRSNWTRSILADVVPTSNGARFAGFAGPPRTPDTASVSLSRFAYLHQVDGILTLENPLSRYRARLYDPLLAALLAARARAPSPNSSRSSPNRPARARTPCSTCSSRRACWTASRTPEPQRTRLRQWGFHDLLFHARSRSGRHDEEIGATFRFTGEIEHEKPVRELPSGPVTELSRPDVGDILAADSTLTEALERRSVHPHPRRRSAHHRPTRRTALPRQPGSAPSTGRHPKQQMPYQGVDKPYPSGGGAGDLDIWLTANRCAGLPRGMYYYDPAGHQLVLVNTGEADIDAMLGVASISAGNSAAPDVLLTITSRFQRLGWKYSGIPYATTLKHVGVLYQTLYLVGTAMGLAPCGLGVGDIDLSTRCFGLDWERESSVGDFMISSAPAGTDRGRHLSQDGPGWHAYNSADWRARTRRCNSHDRHRSRRCDRSLGPGRPRPTRPAPNTPNASSGCGARSPRSPSSCSSTWSCPSSPRSNTPPTSHTCRCSRPARSCSACATC